MPSPNSHSAEEKSASDYYALGCSYEQSADYQAAELSFKKALTLNPKDHAAWAYLALLAERRNAYELADEAVQNSLLLKSDHLNALLMKGRLLGHRKEYEKAEQVFKDLVQRQPEHGGFWYELAGTLEKLADYKQAYSCFERANHYSDPKHMNSTKMLTGLDQISQVYQDISEQHHSEAQAPVRDWPIFVVGCMRSGTSLLNQMLGVHSQLHSEGELTTLVELIQAYDSNTLPPSIAELTRQVWAEPEPPLVETLRQDYEHRLKGIASYGEPAWIIDKLPENAERLGLISRVAPGAAVIHIIRDGREVALSCFKQNFQNYHWYSYNLEHAMRYWMKVIDLARQAADIFSIPYYEVRYEELVREPEATLRGIFDFLGLEFESKCLEYYANAPAIKTASYAQVNKPLYTTSLNMAQNYPEAYAQMTEWGRTGLKDLGYL